MTLIGKFETVRWKFYSPSLLYLTQVRFLNGGVRGVYQFGNFYYSLFCFLFAEYPLFQDLILDNKLCELVIHLALNDAESYVCASATKCLTAMVQVDRLWNEELRDKDLVVRK